MAPNLEYRTRVISSRVRCMIHVLWTCPSAPDGAKKRKGGREGRGRLGGFLAAPFPKARRCGATKVTEAGVNVKDAMVIIVCIYDVS